MARVMMIGYGPLPQAGLFQTPSSTLRARQFLTPILAAGHTVNLYVLPSSGTEGPHAKVPAMTPDTYEGLSYQRFNNADGEFAARALGEQARQLKPDAILAVGSVPSLIGAKMASLVPLWADLSAFGMVQAQGQCWSLQDDAGLEEAWAVERTILRRADKFSAACRPHLHAILGEMAALGRMNRHTFEYQLGHHIPNAADDGIEPDAQDEERAENPLLRGPIVPQEAFIILWSGPFHPGCDPAALVETMDILMAQYPSVHFVSTGGPTEEGEARVARLFEELVEKSLHKDRFHHLGWVESDKLRRICREADLGINMDGRNYATMFGAPTRIQAMARRSLAVASTIGTEISEWLDDAHGLLAAPIGNPGAMALVIEPWIEQRGHLTYYSDSARWTMEKDFDPHKTVRPLLNWLDEPRLSPDNQVKVQAAEGKTTDLNTIALNIVEEEAMLLEQCGVRQLSRSLAELEAIHARPRRRFMFGLR
jgi:glycosyltransferase involved in cell wall biosynthesis